MVKIFQITTTLSFTLITLLSLQCRNITTPTQQNPSEDSTLITKKMTFFNGGLKAGITVEVDTSGGKIRGTLTKEIDYEKQELFLFSSNKPYQEGASICMTFKNQETGYPLPVSQDVGGACWWFGNNEDGAFGLHIPTHGKNYNTGEYRDYTMFLEQVEK